MSNPIRALELSKPRSDTHSQEFYEPSHAGDFATIGTELIMRDLVVLEPLFESAFRWLKAWLISMNADFHNTFGKRD